LQRGCGQEHQLPLFHQVAANLRVDGRRQRVNALAGQQIAHPLRFGLQDFDAVLFHRVLPREPE
jgi:hypothetical protein